MKKVIVLCVLVLLMCGGCWESVLLVFGGAAGGMTTANFLQQQEENVQANIDLMAQQEIDQEAELAATTDPAERARIQEQLDNTRTVKADLEITKAGIVKLREGLGVDWSDPKVVIPFASSLVLLILEELQRRRKKEAKVEAKGNRTALVETIKGGQKFKRVLKETGDSSESASAVKELFTTAMEKEQSPETKKMIAVIKA